MFGRRKPPRPLRPKLESGERLLAWAPTADGAVVVTTFGLFVPGQPRLGWHQIHKATWSGGRLTVIPSVPVGDPVRVRAAEPADGAGAGELNYAVLADGEPVTVALTEPGDVPAEVRARVTRSVAYTAHHPLPGGGVRVVARRVPGRNGLAWHVRYDDGTPIDDPAVRAATTELVAEAAGPDGSE